MFLEKNLFAKKLLFKDISGHGQGPGENGVYNTPAQYKG